MKRLAVRLVALILIGYMLGCAYMFVAQRSFLYHGETPATELGALADAGYQKISYTATDGQVLTGFYRPPPNADAPVMIVFHGNTGIGPIHDSHALPMATLKAGILLATYRGFEGNTGEPTETGLAADALAAYQFVKNQNISDRNIIIYGQSLGTGVATELAAQLTKEAKTPGALILESPFTRMVDMADMRYWYLPTDLILQDRFDTVDKIDDIKAPVLVMHARYDETIPFNMGEQVCNAVQSEKQCAWFDEGGHVHLYDHNGFNVVRDFLIKYFPTI